MCAITNCGRCEGKSDQTGNTTTVCVYCYCMYLSLLCYMCNIILSESSDMYELRIYLFLREAVRNIVGWTERVKE